MKRKMLSLQRLPEVLWGVVRYVSGVALIKFIHYAKCVHMATTRAPQLPPFAWKSKGFSQLSPSQIWGGKSVPTFVWCLYVYKVALQTDLWQNGETHTHTHDEQQVILTMAL